MEVEMVAVGMGAETVVATEGGGEAGETVEEGLGVVGSAGGREEGETEEEELAVVAMAEVATVGVASEVDNQVVEARAEGG